MAPPGQREVGDPVVAVGQLEIEDAGEVAAPEAQIPRGEVAVYDRVGLRVRAQPGDPLAGVREVPAQEANLVRAFLFALGQDAVERRVGEDRLAASPGTALTYVGEPREVGVEVGQ